MRDLTDGFQKKPDAGRIFLSPLTWLLTIAGQIAVVAIIVLGILAGPPLFVCQGRAQGGLFAGETFGGCVMQGLSQRMGQFEQRIRKLIRGSGR